MVRGEQVISGYDNSKDHILFVGIGKLVHNYSVPSGFWWFFAELQKLMQNWCKNKQTAWYLGGNYRCCFFFKWQLIFYTFGQRLNPSSTYRLSMNTALIESSYMCVFTQSSLEEDSCVCTFANLRKKRVLCKKKKKKQKGKSSLEKGLKNEIRNKRNISRKIIQSRSHDLTPLIIMKILELC